MYTRQHGVTETRHQSDRLLQHKDLTDRILSCAVKVDVAVGPGLREPSYLNAATTLAANTPSTASVITTNFHSCS
jgi:hypothetical protein